MSDTVHSYWNSYFLKEEEMGIVTFTSFVNVKKLTYILIMKIWIKFSVWFKMYFS